MQIYLITNKINQKKYVGQTIKPLEVRFAKHCGGHEKTIITKAIKKYGKENFSIETLEECLNINELNEREEFYIRELSTLIPVGYNVSLGGKNKTMHESTKKKISQAHSGRPKSREHATNVKKRMLEIDPDYYRNLGKQRKLKPFSSTQRQNLSNSKNKTSRFVGVSKDRESFRAEFYFKGSRVCLSFLSEEAAGQAYDLLCVERGLSAVNLPDKMTSWGELEKFREIRKRESRFLGVKKHVTKKGVSFSSIIWLNGKANYLGRFSTEEDAAKSVDAFLLKNGRQAKNFSNQPANSVI